LQSAQPRPRAQVASSTAIAARKTARASPAKRFQVAVGYEPKRLARILRLQRLLALAERMPPGRGRLAALALAAGYADQAHMARECAELAGITPGALLPGAASALALTDFFKTA